MDDIVNWKKNLWNKPAKFPIRSYSVNTFRRLLVHRSLTDYLSIIIMVKQDYSRDNMDGDYDLIPPNWYPGVVVSVSVSVSVCIHNFSRVFRSITVFTALPRIFERIHASICVQFVILQVSLMCRATGVTFVADVCPVFLPSNGLFVSHT